MSNQLTQSESSLMRGEFEDRGAHDHLRLGVRRLKGLPGLRQINRLSSPLGVVVGRIRPGRSEFGSVTTMQAAAPPPATVDAQPLPRDVCSLQAVNFPGLLVRHRNSLGEISRISSGLDRNDATADNKHVASVSTQPVSGTPLTWTYEYSSDALTKSCNSEQKCTTYGSAQGSHYRSAVLDSKPEGYFRFSDDGADNDATNEVDITLNDGFGVYSGVEFGKDSPLAAVDDADKSVKFTSSSSVRLPTGMATRSRDGAIEMWFKTSGTNVQPLLGYQKRMVPRFEDGVPVLYVGSDGKLRGQFWHGSAEPMTSGVAVNDNQWHHVVLSSMGARQSLYLDGAAIGSITQSVVDHEQFPVNLIGVATTETPTAWPAFGALRRQHFTGQIDEVALYSHPLSTKEVVAHWQQGSTPSDQLTSITSAAGRTTAELEYNPAKDRVRRYVDADGGAWTLGDPQVIGNDKDLRRLVNVTGPGATSYAYEYDALGGWLLRTGRPIAADTHKPVTADARPHWPDIGYSIRSYTHDETGQLMKVTSETGGEVSMTYDARGNVVSTKTCRTAPAADCKTEYSTYHADVAWQPLDPRWDKLAAFRDGRSASATDDTYKRSRNVTVSGDVAAEASPGGGYQT